MVPDEMGAPVEITDQQRKVVEAMTKLGAVDQGHGKTADDIMKFGKFGKGQMLSWMAELEKKGVVRRVAGTKAAHYFVVKPV